MGMLRGRVAWKFGDHFDVDLIIGVKNIAQKDILKLSSVAMADFSPNFADSVKPGDLLVAGHNFGYGHPHTQGMAVMKHLGIKAVIAESFAHGFFRGEYGFGLFLLPCTGISAFADRGDELEIDIQNESVINHSFAKIIRLNPIPRPALDIMLAGGLLPYLKRRCSDRLRSTE